MKHLREEPNSTFKWKLVLIWGTPLREPKVLSSRLKKINLPKKYEEDIFLIKNFVDKKKFGAK